MAFRWDTGGRAPAGLGKEGGADAVSLRRVGRSGNRGHVTSRHVMSRHFPEPAER